MGWKNVKEAYQITHIVCVTEEGICIGSGYVHNLIVIDLNGNIKKREVERSNNDLLRYQREMDADPTQLRQLVTTPDSFNASIPVFTYADGEIIEKQCETPGYPNATHDGCLMYENTFSTDRQQVVEWAKHDVDIHIKTTQEHIQGLKRSLVEQEALLDKLVANRAKLEV